MIKLDVKEYCHRCPNFEVEVNKDVLYSCTIIRCKHRRTCAQIECYIEKKLSNPSDE